MVLRKHKNDEDRDTKSPAVRVSVITGLFVVLAAVIGKIPSGTSRAPLACSIENSVIQGIYSCNTTEIHLEDRGDAATDFDITQTAVTERQTAQPTVDWDRTETSIPVTLTALAPPTPTQNIMGTRTVPSSTPRPEQIGITAFELDELFGGDNWFCYPDRLNAVGVRSLNVGFIVQHPITLLDTPIGTFHQGDFVGASTSANAELVKFIASFRECPRYQAPYIENWNNAPPPDAGDYFDNLFGHGNWKCEDKYAHALYVSNLEQDLLVDYPFTSVDQYQKYGLGDIVPRGSPVTAWTFMIPRDDCP